MADREAVPTAPSEPDKPGVMDRLRNRFAWFNRIMVAQDRYNYCKGDFYAAGITYFTIFALFPLLMVGFSIGGFVLANQPDLMTDVEERIRSSVSGDLGSQLVELMDSAIDSRGTVGAIGLFTAAWAGLGWMANLREALSQMWEQRHEPGGFVATKLSDLLALVSAFVALALTIGLTALSKESPMTTVLGWFGLQDVPGLSVGLQVASWVFALGISWLLFTWIIARLPRESVSFRSSLRAGLIAAVAFEVFKQVASIYLRSVVTGPAGATFGPVLGLMVFAYITARLILFATAWAATAPENLEAVPIEPPGPVRISPRIEVREGVGMSGAVASFAVGAIGALGLSRLLRSRR
ncbi:MAG: inner membrane protein YhjD [Mycobacterium sp.]|nr:inner membrane protein YhjD [Mycobacterium sp.]